MRILISGPGALHDHSGWRRFTPGWCRTNTLSVLIQCFALTAHMSVLWFLCGYSLSFSGGHEGGRDDAASFIGGLDKVGLAGVSMSSVAGTIPEALWVLYQMTFAIITPALMIGAIVGAEV